MATSARADTIAQGGDGPAPSGECIILGVTGGIAAYKAVEVCRRLVSAGFHVVPVMTATATRFLGEATLSALASEPVRKSLFEGAGPIVHTTLGRRADLVLVVPATARFIACYANGIADGLLLSTVLATRAPVVVCPAMHTEMWEHPALRHNLELLVERGVLVVPPEEGPLAGGDQGAGRLASPENILDGVTRALRRRELDLSGLRVLVSAGGTREPIDPVRVITNRSSGKQGHALAVAAAERGAEVVLVTAASLPGPTGASVVRVETAAQMEQAVLERAAGCDVVVMAAAVADFRPKVTASSKISKSEGTPELVLEPTPDILAELSRRRGNGQVLVGFAAETGDVAVRAKAKLQAKAVDLMVANDVSAPGAGFDCDTNAVTITGADGSVVEVPLASKREVADAVLDSVVALLRRDNPLPRSTK